MFVKVCPRWYSGCSLTLFSVPLLYSLAATMLAPAYPLFIKGLVGRDGRVGLVVAYTGIVWILATLLSDAWIARLGKAKVLMVSLIGFSVGFLALTLVDSVVLLLIVEAFRVGFGATAGIVSALMIKGSAVREDMGRTQGLFYGLMNVTWLVGPAIGGTLAGAFGFDRLLAIAALLPLGALIVQAKDRRENRPRLPRAAGPLLLGFRDYLRDKNLVILYVLSLGLSCWWVFVYTFVPLFLASLGERTIGYVLSASVLPLILLEAPFGRIADRWSYKRPMVLGFLLMGGSALGASFAPSTITLILMILAGSVGSAFVEPLRDAYFFRLVPEEKEVRFLAVFKTGYELGFLVAPLLYSLILLSSRAGYPKLLWTVSGILCACAFLSSRLLPVVRRERGRR